MIATSSYSLTKSNNFITVGGELIQSGIKTDAATNRIYRLAVSGNGEDSLVSPTTFKNSDMPV